MVLALDGGTVRSMPERQCPNPVESPSPGQETGPEPHGAHAGCPLPYNVCHGLCCTHTHCNISLGNCPPLSYNSHVHTRQCWLTDNLQSFSFSDVRMCPPDSARTDLAEAAGKVAVSAQDSPAVLHSGFSPRHDIDSLADIMALAPSASPPLLGGLVLDFDNTLAVLRTAHAQMMAEGAQTAQQYMEAQGMELFPEFWEQIIDARQFALQKSDEEEEEHIANDTMSFLLQFCGYPASRLDEQVLTTAVDLFYAPEMLGWDLFPGVTDTLEVLDQAGLRLAIVANYPCERVFQRTIDYLQLRPYFDMILCSASVEWRKPNPEIFTPVLQRWNLQPHEIAVVGDSLKHDVAGGQQLGAMTVQCELCMPDEQTAFDNQRLKNRIKPDAVLRAWPDLVSLVAEWR